MIEYRGIRFMVWIRYAHDDPMHYDIEKIKPLRDDADFLDYYRDSDEWPAVDRLIDQQMQEWIALHERAEAEADEFDTWTR